MAFLSKLFGGKSLDHQFVEAVKLRDQNKVIELLEAGANVNSKAADGLPVLGHALNSSDVEMVKLLIDRGADVELTDNKGITPLVAAVFMGLKEGVQLLIDAGANPERKVVEMSPLDVAWKKQDAEIYELLQSRYSVDKKIVEAASRWNRDQVKKLLDVGANINAQNTAGVTLLACAINVSDVEMTKFLIERGADVELAANDGMTPLMVAVFREFTEGVRFLLNAGANPERAVGEGSAILLAEAKGLEKIYAILTANVANRQNPFVQKLEDEDPMLAQAKAAALRGLPQFIKMFNERDTTPSYVFSVKVPIEDENGREHLWLMVYEINEQFILGTIGNDPAIIKNFKYGDAIQSPYESVEDIMVADKEMNFVMGGHTLKAIINRNKP